MAVAASSSTSTTGPSSKKAKVTSASVKKTSKKGKVTKDTKSHSRSTPPPASFHADMKRLHKKLFAKTAGDASSRKYTATDSYISALADVAAQVCTRVVAAAAAGKQPRPGLGFKTPTSRTIKLNDAFSVVSVVVADPKLASAYETAARSAVRRAETEAVAAAASTDVAVVVAETN